VAGAAVPPPWGEQAANPTALKLMKIRFKRSTIRRTTAFSRDFDFKPWCEEKGVATSEIDFAFYNRRSGLCLIATSEANHLKLKELLLK
jgi:hypothetical protein